MLQLPSSKTIAALLSLALAGCSVQSAQSDPREEARQDTARTEIGLFTTLPIYWGEGGDIASVLNGQVEDGWVRQALEENSEILPLDTLEAGALNGIDQVILAQPRPLAPSENVAFDNWLREGGRALIFADPMLTQHSDHPLGDPRRPHDMVVISPILARWGLDLVFDEEQPSGERFVPAEGSTLPVELAGHFEPLDEAGYADCDLSAEGLVADCKVGEGRALLIADAALLDDHHPDAARKSALASLIDRIFHH